MSAFRRPTAFIAALTLALASFALPSGPALAQDNLQGLAVHEPYARVLTGVGGTGAVFFTLHNHGQSAVTVTGVSTDAARMAEFHTHVESADGLMQMLVMEGGIVVPAASEHVFSRGGDHVMLMGLTRELKDGDTVTLTLTFDRADPLTFDAVIDNARVAGAMDGHDMSAMAGHDHKTSGEKTHDHAAMGHGTAAPDTTGMSDADAIVTVLNAQFDTPEHPLRVEPVVVQGDHALASWAQGDRGGRSLLERRAGQWTVVLCAGPDLRLPAFLVANGVPVAEMLSQMFNAAEDQLGADKVALFSSFEGVVRLAEPQE